VWEGHYNEREKWKSELECGKQKMVNKCNGRKDQYDKMAKSKSFRVK
jgi:hypothetical protein